MLSQISDTLCVSARSVNATVSRRPLSIGQTSGPPTQGLSALAAAIRSRVQRGENENGNGNEKPVKERERPP